MIDCPYLTTKCFTFADTFCALPAFVHRLIAAFGDTITSFIPDVTLDPGFKDFYAYAKEHDIPVVVVSSGMVPIIRSIFSKLIGEEEASKIDVIANEVIFTDPDKKGDTWKLVYRHPDNHYGHDKSKSILPYRNLPDAPLIFFCGDGISDMSAAAHADVLFVK